ncbi:FecR family protein [Pedobacter hartonius]|uniref:FecR family protein n=1 Tax=Pedobacter hartonius TaxID=425514 RepID=A0A1H4CYL6_9SPHI|nr:FecR domain-containing protein [Pedobacter hartonius]SEA65481.1 FecR family protein [Pedobacter hartonius]
MKKDISKDLLQKYEDGTCTPEEVNKVEDWYRTIAKENAGTPFAQNLIVEELASLEQIRSSRKRKETIVIRLYQEYKRFAVAALICFSAGIGVYLMFAGRNDGVFENDVDPGKNQAVLTLENGKRIKLTDAENGELATLPGMRVSKTKNGELMFQVTGSSPTVGNSKKSLNTIETPKGGQYMVCLPDGSKVWLNAASTLSFPTTFDVTRNVALSGEAYFEIKKDKAHPFIVTSPKQTVQVLGTHFNVSSYPEDIVVKTTLLEGSVRVSGLQKGTETSSNVLILKPNEQSVNNGLTMNVGQVEAENEIDWHNGTFAFKRETLGEIMKELARWYDLKVTYQDTALQQLHFVGRASRYAKISDILCQMQLTKEVKFKITGKEITVMR